MQYNKFKTLPFMIQIVNKIGLEVNYLIIIHTTKTSMLNRLNIEKPKIIPTGIKDMTKKCLLFLLVLLLELLTRIICQEKLNVIQLEKSNLYVRNLN